MRFHALPVNKTPTGTRRIFRKFLWWPVAAVNKKTMLRECRWLEFAWVEQDYGPHTDDGIGMAINCWATLFFLPNDRAATDGSVELTRADSNVPCG